MREFDVTIEDVVGVDERDFQRMVIQNVPDDVDLTVCVCCHLLPSVLHVCLPDARTGIEPI